MKFWRTAKLNPRKILSMYKVYTIIYLSLLFFTKINFIIIFHCKQCWYFQKWASWHHPKWSGKPYHTILRCVHITRWTADWWCCQEPADIESRKHCVWCQTINWSWVERWERPERLENVSVQGVRRIRKATYSSQCQPVWGEEVFSGRDQCNGAYENEGIILL